jgi:hypothetical protein
MIRCLYCGGDWTTHNSDTRRFCNRRLNVIRRQAAELERAKTDPDFEPKVRWSIHSDVTKGYNANKIRKFVTSIELEDE